MNILSHCTRFYKNFLENLSAFIVSFLTNVWSILSWYKNWYFICLSKKYRCYMKTILIPLLKAYDIKINWVLIKKESFLVIRFSVSDFGRQDKWHCLPWASCYFLTAWFTLGINQGKKHSGTSITDREHLVSPASHAHKKTRLLQ